MKAILMITASYIIGCSGISHVSGASPSLEIKEKDNGQCKSGDLCMDFAEARQYLNKKIDQLDQIENLTIDKKIFDVLDLSGGVVSAHDRLEFISGFVLPDKHKWVEWIDKSCPEDSSKEECITKISEKSDKTPAFRTLQRKSQLIYAILRPQRGGEFYRELFNQWVDDIRRIEGKHASFLTRKNWAEVFDFVPRQRTINEIVSLIQIVLLDKLSNERMNLIFSEIIYKEFESISREFSIYKKESELAKDQLLAEISQDQEAGEYLTVYNTADCQAYYNSSQKSINSTVITGLLGRTISSFDFGVKLAHISSHEFVNFSDFSALVKERCLYTYKNFIIKKEKKPNLKLEKIYVDWIFLKKMYSRSLKKKELLKMNNISITGCPKNIPTEDDTVKHAINAFERVIGLAIDKIDGFRRKSDSISMDTKSMVLALKAIDEILSDEMKHGCSSAHITLRKNAPIIEKAMKSIKSKRVKHKIIGRIARSRFFSNDKECGGLSLAFRHLVN